MRTLIMQSKKKNKRYFPTLIVEKNEGRYFKITVKALMKAFLTSYKRKRT